MDSSPTYYAHLDFNAPLSESRADAIARRLAARRPVDLLDVGCGWAELALRIAAASPGTTTVGIDTDERLLERGRQNAAARGLSDRVDLVHRAGTDQSDPADLVLCIGSSQAFGTQQEALERLRPLVRPGGRLLFGEGFWEPTGPVDRDLVWDDVLELPDLAGLVDLAVAAGYRPLWVETAGRDEWEAFESGYLADDEEWLQGHRDHLDADRVRAASDDHRTRWLRGYRNGLGFGYLTLGVPHP